MKRNSIRNKHLLVMSIVCCLSIPAASAQTYPIFFTEIRIDSLITISDVYESFYRNYPEICHRQLRRMVLTTVCENSDYRSSGPAVWIHYRMMNNTDSDMIVESFGKEKRHTIYESHSFWYKGKEFTSEPKPAIFLGLNNTKIAKDGENDYYRRYIEPGENATGMEMIFFFEGTDFEKRLSSIPYNKVNKSYRENRKVERIARKVLPTVSIKLEIREIVVE